jgi:hypothetical protein
MSNSLGRKFDGYAIVNGSDADFNAAQKTLASHVELQMIKGWRPQGGVIFLGQFTEMDGVTKLVFCQAMILPKAEE